MTTEIETTTTYVEVVLKVTHDKAATDEALFKAVETSLAGTVAIINVNPAGSILSSTQEYADGYAGTNPGAVWPTELHTVWVKGARP